MFKRDTKNFSQLIVDPYYCKDPKLYEIFKKCLPPREAYYYFPKPEEILVINKEKNEESVRRIFTNVPFTNFEKKWLKELQKIIDSEGDVLPMGWNDGISLGCIYTALGDIKFAHEIMLDYIKWFETNFPMYIKPRDKSWELLNNGFLYIYGRDHQFRPIMVCQPYILQNSMDYFSNSDVVNVCLFVCQFAVNNLLIPGQIENWIMFFNLKGTSLLSLPEPIKQLVQELSDNFNFRLAKCYVLGMSFIMRILYRFVSNFIGQPNEDKIVILDGKKDKHLFDDFNPYNLEKRFGGMAEDLVYGGENSLFPPRVPSDNVFLPYENKNNILITEEEYINRCKKGLIPLESISPYIMDKLEQQSSKVEIKKENTFNSIIKKEQMNDIIIPPPNPLLTQKSNINDKRKSNKIFFHNNIKSNDNTDYSSGKSNIIPNKTIIKQFLNYSDWRIQDEFKEEKIYRQMSSYLFMNEIKKFSHQKEKFKRGISKIK